MSPSKLYYSECNRTEPYVLDDLKRITKILFDQYLAGRYFDISFGYNYGNNLSKPRKTKFLFEDQLKFDLCREDILPISENIAALDMNTCFDLIEFMYRYIAEPSQIDGRDGEIMRYDISVAQTELLEKINPYLRHFGTGFELTKNGEIIRLGAEYVRDLMRNISVSGDEEHIDSKVRRAVQRFQSSAKSVDDIYQAVMDLIGVLEYLQKSGELQFNNKDESDLFRIANNFCLRHNRPDQQSEYDKEIWYEWMFFTYLNAIRVTLQLKARAPSESRGSEETQSNED